MGGKFRMKKEMIQKLHKSFEDRAHREDGVEFWFARELQGCLAMPSGATLLLSSKKRK